MHITFYISLVSHTSNNRISESFNVNLRILQLSWEANAEDFGRLMDFKEVLNHRSLNHFWSIHHFFEMAT